MKRILIFLILVQSVICTAVGQVPGHRIAFVSDRHHPGTGGDIYSMDVDGSNVVRLTISNAVKCTPTWSPDGRRILFSDVRNGNEDIYRINADGTNEVRLTSTPGRDQRPSWSPDGQKIVFQSTRDGNGEIYSMNSDGTGQVRLTSNTVSDSDPDWSPDGERILFSSTRGGSETAAWQDLYTMKPDGSAVVRLTTNLYYDSQAQWSPDGTRIVFVSNRAINFQIFVMNADGTGQTRITNHPFHDREPCWSDDGGWIAFESNRVNNGKFQIFKMRADGTGAVALTTPANWDFWADWTSSAIEAGSKILFQTDRSPRGVYTMNPDGSQQVLTILDETAPSPLIDFPRWSPDGSKIAFLKYVHYPDGVLAQELFVWDGTLQRQITALMKRWIFGFSWSPDGNSIVYSVASSDTYYMYTIRVDTYLAFPSRIPFALGKYPSWSKSGRIVFLNTTERGIHSMKADGTNIRLIKSSLARLHNPEPSPDGKRIVYKKSVALFIIHEDGSNDHQIITSPNPYDLWLGSWSPSGERIVFRNRVAGNADIYVMNVDGTGIQRLTTNIEVDTNPHWTPRH